MITSYNVRRFFSHEAGGASPSQSQAEDSSQQQSADPFAAINLDDLDPATRAVVEATKTQFATMQKENAENRAKLLKTDQLARAFQSKADAAQAEILRIKGSTEPVDQKLLAVEKVLADKGFSPEQIKVQAPIFAEMFGVFAEQIKGDIGRDLAPLGVSVMQGEAQRAFMQAESMDKIAALQIPEVRQKTWEGVQQLISTNQPVTAQTVINLRNIFYTEHQENNNGQNMPVNPQYSQPPPFQMGMGNFAGGGNSPQRPQQRDPNAPRHTLNADTAAAIAQVTSRWPKKGGK